MTQITWRNVDRQVVERLKLRAQRNGRSLDEEIKVILEEVAAAEVVNVDTLHQIQQADNQERLRQAQAKYLPDLEARSFEIASTQGLRPLHQPTDSPNVLDVVEVFQQLRQAIHWNNAPIRDLIDEGRRF